MRLKKDTVRLCAVMEYSSANDSKLFEQIQMILEGGATLIQFREKSSELYSFLMEARQIKMLCLQYGVPFIIDNNVQIAQAVDADGVYLRKDTPMTGVRERLGADKLIGVSVETVQQAWNAQADGADYLVVGDNLTVEKWQMQKEDILDTLRKICENVTIPVIAAGAITLENVTQVGKTGVDGIAVVRALLEQGDVIAATKILRKRIEDILI